jgi:antitoxin component of RelBE/YafQ-DinJ toxin-antitoxin module
VLKKKETLTIRVQPGLKKRLKTIAKNYGLNLSTLTRIWLIDKLKEVKTAKMSTTN